MKKKLFGVLGLTFVLSMQSLYAEEVIFPDLLVQQQPKIDDHAGFEVIQDENATTDNTTTSNAAANNTTIDNNNENAATGNDLNQGTPGTVETSSTDKTENISNKVILTIDSEIAIVDGQEQTLLAPPTVINNTTLLPMRFTADNVGAQVEWEPNTQTATMRKDGKVVSVKIGSKIATVDGTEVELLTEPIVKNNTTLVPLRFISECFNVGIEYDPVTKKITLDKGVGSGQNSDQTPNQMPIASFYFPESYVAGQTVSVVNESYDPDGDTISDQLWCIMGEKILTNKELSNMFKTPRAGTYTIGLKVQDAKGLWSDWNYQSVTILPNQAPVITSLEPTQASFARGESIQFLPYTYENESWETVSEGKWTYRGINEARETLGKPTALFEEGDYVVALYLDDAYGNRSQKYEATVHISSEVRDTELNYKFSIGAIGEWIDNFGNTNYLSYKQAQVINQSYDYGTLIMSDSPEEVRGMGILYQDMINGSGRILIHHINQVDSSETQRFVFVVENPTTEKITITLKNKSIKGPAPDILRVGQLCLNEYLSGAVAPETITLNPGEKKFIYDKKWAVNACISAHMDVETTGKAKFIIANIGTSDTLDTISSMYYFPADGVHYSGTYDKVAINYTLNLSGTEPERLTLGVANANEWVVGYDERTQTPVENKGNFGVSYKIIVTAQEDMGVILNNRGGMFQGAIKWNGSVYNMPGKGTFVGTTTKAVVMGVINKGETVTIEYLLPNGSAAPTLIGFIPRSQW